MKRKLLLFFLLFLALITATFVYINKIFLPIQLKDIITEKASAALNRKVELGALHFNPFQGIILDNLKIYRRDTPEELFVHIRKASFHLLYTPLITQKKVIIPSMDIDTPSVHIIRGTDGLWNFQDLMDRPKDKESEGALMIGTVLVNDGRIKVSDQRDGMEYDDFIENVHIDTTLSLKKGAQFLLEFRLPADKGSFTLHGHYDFLKRAVDGTAKFSEIHPRRFLRFLDYGGIPDLREGRFSEGHITFTYSEDALSANGQFTAEQMDLFLPNGDHIKGNIKASKASVTRNNGVLRLSGLVTSDGLSYARSDGAACSAQLRSSIKDLTIGKITTATFGAELSETHCDLPASAATFQGGITTGQTTITLAEDWTIKSDFQVSSSAATLGEDGFFEGSIISPAFNFHSGPEGIQAEGTVTADIHELRSAEQTIKGILSLENAKVTHAEGRWAFIGKAQLQQASVQLPGQSAKGNFALNNATLSFEGGALTLNGGVSATEAMIHAGGQSVKGNFRLDDIVLRKGADFLQVNTNMDMENGEIALTEKITFFGSPKIHLSVEKTLDSVLSYSGRAQFVKGIIRGLPDINQVTDLSGTIAFQNDQARTEALSFNILNAPLELQGTLQGFRDPVLSIHASSPEMDFAKIQAAFPDIFEKAGIILDGTAKVVVDFAGRPGDIGNATINGEAVLKDVSLGGAKLPDPITGLSGIIRYQSNLVEWEHLAGQWKGQELRLTGRLTDFKRPSVTTTVKGADLDASAELTLLRSAMDIRSLKGTYAGQSFAINGRIDRPKGETPTALLNVNADIDLATLPSAHTSLKQIIESHGIAGKVHMEGSARGPLTADWPAWDVDFQMSAPSLTTHGYTMQEALVTLITRSRKVTKLSFNALFYEGRLELVGSSELDSQMMPFNAALRLENANITKLKEATPFKNKELAGYLSSTFVGQGFLKNPQALEGKGSINISEGRLWELNMLKGLLTFLLIPEYKDITFTAARANFEVRNRQLVTDSMELISPKLTLAGKGIINFDQSINMHVSPRIDPGHILKSESLRKGSTAILLQGQQIVSVRITGSLKKPKYEIDKSIGKALENATGAVMDGVINIFGDIF